MSGRSGSTCVAFVLRCGSSYMFEVNIRVSRFAHPVGSCHQCVGLRRWIRPMKEFLIAGVLGWVYHITSNSGG